MDNVIMVSVAAGLAVLVGLFVFLKHWRQQAVLKGFYERLEKEPTNAVLWYNLAHLFLSMGRIDKARLCVERLLSIDAEKAKSLEFVIEHPEFRVDVDFDSR
jgi:hypothetical protein